MDKAKIVHCLLRVGPKERLLDLQKSGRLYMNSLRYFKHLEKSDTLRSDPSEGLSASHPASKVVISVEVDGILRPIPNLVGQVRIGDSRDEYTKIFSLYAITEKTEDFLFDDRILGFGDSALVILYGDEFLKRVRGSFASRGLPCKHDLVEYVDKDSHSGEMGPFRKYSELEFQSEFRISTLLPTSGPLTDFSIGDISDISHLGDSSTLRDRLKTEEM